MRFLCWLLRAWGSTVAAEPELVSGGLCLRELGHSRCAALPSTSRTFDLAVLYTILEPLFAGRSALRA